VAVQRPGDCSTAGPAGGTVMRPPCSFLLAPGVSLDLKTSFYSSLELKSYPESKIHHLEAQLNQRNRNLTLSHLDLT